MSDQPKEGSGAAQPAREAREFWLGMDFNGFKETSPNGQWASHCQAVSIIRADEIIRVREVLPQSAGSLEHPIIVTGGHVPSKREEDAKAGGGSVETSACNMVQVVGPFRPFAWFIAQEVGAGNIKHNAEYVAYEDYAKLEAEKKMHWELIKDHCGDEIEIAKICAEVIGQEWVDGDSYGVPTPVDCVEETIRQLKAKIASGGTTDKP